MNLLLVQDALKNASDQQLMQMMQSPDSTAPSYLVLSEIRRRKDMRSKQAPEGQSNRTVAEDLTAPQEPVGIQGLQEQPPQGSMDPDGVDAADGGVPGMAAGGLASLRRYREGGVVRMQAGGDIMGDIPFPTSNYEDMTIPPALQSAQDRPAQPSPTGRLPVFRPFLRSGDAGMMGATREIQAAIRANPSARNDATLFDRVAGQYGVSADALRQTVLGAATPAAQAPGGVAALGTDAPMRPQIAALGEDEPRRALPPAANAAQPPAIIPPRDSNRTDVDGGGQPARPATTRTEQPAPVTPGLDGLRNAPAALPEGGQLPTMADLMRQNAALFPDGMGSIRDRMREERVDPAARRNEAVNMALIEAGLRIAGSRNPSLIGAIGEGALPAVQSYSQQLGQIRTEQRQARQDDLELAKQDTNRQFAIGQISAAEYRSRMDNINANMRVNAQERGANARTAATITAAERRAVAEREAAEASDLRRGYVSPERWARMSTEERAALERNRTLGRPADTSGASSVLNSAMQNIERIQTAAAGDLEPPRSSRDYAAWERRNADRQARLRQAEELIRESREILLRGRSPSGAGGTPSGTTNLPSGARIENGRYVPAGS